MWRWNLPAERWSAAFGTRSTQEVTARLAQLRKGLARWEDLTARFDGEELQGVFRTQCVIPTCFGRAPSFCNSVMAYYYRQPGPYLAKHLYHVALADGSAFPAQTLSVIAEHAERLTYQVTWQTGDMLLVDNSRWMHGRRWRWSSRASTCPTAS